MHGDAKASPQFLVGENAVEMNVLLETENLQLGLKPFEIYS